MELRPYQTDLINQVAQSWREGCKRPCVVLPCGGGKSIIAADMARRTTDRGKHVLFLVHRQELCEQIEKTFSGYGVDMQLCTVGMVQTVTRRLDRTEKPSLILIDECHHILATSYTRILDYFQYVPCVGITATPIRLNGSGLGDVNDKLIVGLSVKQLIEYANLAPFDYYAPPVADLSGIHIKRGEFDAEEVEKALSKPHIYGDVIRYYRDLSDGKQAICYCASIKYSQDMTEQFQLAGIEARHIDGKTPKPERAEIVKLFRAGTVQILCNVDLISEGFDVPDCTTAILLRPTKSLTLFTQQSMRCMRYKPDKRAVIIDHVGNVHRFGLPDTDRVWSLESKASDAKKEESTVKVKQCPECFYTHVPAPVCPKCGYVYEVERKSPKEEKQARLEKIVDGYTAPEECKGIDELFAYAKKKGYKPGWGYFQAKQRGYLR